MNKIKELYNTKPVRKTIYVLSILLVIIIIPMLVGTLLPEPFNFWFFSLMISLLGLLIIIPIIITCVGVFRWIIYDTEFDWDNTVSDFFNWIEDAIDDFLLD